MKALRYLAMAFIFVLLVFSGLFLQVKTAADYSILNLSFYENFMEEHHLYEIPQDYVLLQIKLNNCQGLPDPVCKSLSAAIDNSFSPDWTRNQSNNFIRTYLAYLKNESDQLDLSLDLLSRKTILKQELVGILNGYPQEMLQACGIDAYYTNQLAENLWILSQLPDTITISGNTCLDNPFITQYTDTIRCYYPYIKYIPYILFGILIFLMLMLAGKLGGMRWVGCGLTLSGILLVLILSAGSDYIDTMIVENLSGKHDLLASLGSNPIILTTLFKNSIMSVLNRVGILFSLCGSLIAAAGIILEVKLSRRRKAAFKAIS